MPHNTIHDFFDNCSRFVGNNSRGNLSDAERGFLTTIEYFDGEDDALVIENRRALLTLTAKQSDFFRLPSPNSPDLFFFGSKLKPDSFPFTQPYDLNLGVAGRGFTPKAAFESCLGEAAEFLSFHEQIDDPLLAPNHEDHLVCETDWAWCVSEIGLDGNIPPDAMDAFIVERICDKENFALPAEFVLRRPAAVRLGSKKATTNGLGAGRTPDEARYSGLMEVVERDAVACWWFGGNAAKRADEHLIQSQELSKLHDDNRSADAKKSWFLDVTSDLGIPVVICLSCEEDGTGISAGFGADLNWRIAAKKSFLEMCQVEIAQQLSLNRYSRLPPEQLNETDRMWLAKHEKMNLDNYPELYGNTGDIAVQNYVGDLPLDEAVHEIQRHGFGVFFANLTRREVGIPVFRAIVPGLSPSKPDKNCTRLLTAMEINQRNLETLDTRVAII